MISLSNECNSFSDKKRSLGLGAASKAAAGLAALLPVATNAATQVFTPTVPLTHPDSYSFYWDPFSDEATLSYVESSGMLYMNFCGANLLAGLGRSNFDGPNTLSIDWVSTPVGDNTIINEDSTFSPSSLFYYTPASNLVGDGEHIYFGYRINGDVDAYGWVRFENNDSILSITEWAINLDEGQISTGAIPEPASMGVLAGLLFMGVACFSRWRKRR